MKKEEYDFLDDDFQLSLCSVVIVVLFFCFIYIQVTPIIKENNFWNKKLETCELNSFDDNNEQAYKFICEDGTKISKKKIDDEQWENIKEKNNCKIISYDYETRIKTWSCNNSVIVKNKFK